MSDFVNTIDLLGDNAVANSIIEGTITEFKDNIITQIINGAFYGNVGKLKILDCPNLIGSCSMYCASGLEYLNLPLVNYVDAQVCDGAKNLTYANIPNVKNLGNWAFRNCKSLDEMDFNVITSIGNTTFQSCPLTKLIIRTETMCTLGGVNALGGSNIANGTGYIYVPRALVDSYKAASNWSTYANQFRALEDYTVDGTTTGALDETKI